MGPQRSQRLPPAPVMDLADRFGLAGTASIVTGAGSGIGRACAILLAEVGSSVCVVDRDAEAAARAVTEIAAAGGQAFAHEADAREASAAGDAVRLTAERFGRVDVLVNNVGGTFSAPAQDLTPGGWSAVMRLNLDTTFQFSQAAARVMLAAGKGSIVNVASIAGVAAAPGSAHYGAAKAGVINLTRTLALEWAPKVRVNCVAPDFILTPAMEGSTTEADRRRIAGAIPLGRLGAPEDVAGAVVFLASDMASFVTGQTLVIDGGNLFRSRLDFEDVAPSGDR